MGCVPPSRLTRALEMVSPFWVFSRPRVRRGGAPNCARGGRAPHLRSPFVFGMVWFCSWACWLFYVAPSSALRAPSPPMEEKVVGAHGCFHAGIYLRDIVFE